VKGRLGRAGFGTVAPAIGGMTWLDFDEMEGKAFGRGGW
jgi:hypothetical protein